MEPDALVIADRSFGSRLIVGTGKYPSQEMKARARSFRRRDGDGRGPSRGPLDRSTESLLA